MSTVDRLQALTDQPIHQCYHCHKCRAGCPVLPALDYGPDRMLRMLQLGHWERVLSSRDIWLCLGCEMCGAHCPNGIDVGEVMIALRELAAEEGYRCEDCSKLRDKLRDKLREGVDLELSEQPSETVAEMVDDRLCVGAKRLNRLSETIAGSHSVSGDENSARLIWSQDLERVPEGLTGRPGADLVYFVGCVGAFFPQSCGVPQALTRVLGAAEIDFTTLGGDEWCCGYPLLALGEGDRADLLARHNVAELKSLEARQLVTTCPSCYHMCKHIYPSLLGRELGVDVLHATELLASLIDAGRLPMGELSLQVTYLVERFLQILKLAGSGHEDYHRQLPTIIRQFDSSVVTVVRMAKPGRLLHHRNFDFIAIEQVEFTIAGIALFELRFPRRIEVHRVGENQSRQLIDSSLRYQVLDTVFSLLLNPVVNNKARFFRRLLEVEYTQPGAIVHGERVEVVREKRVSFLAPDGIHDTESKAFVILAFGTLATR